MGYQEQSIIFRLLLFLINGLVIAWSAGTNFFVANACSCKYNVSMNKLPLHKQVQVISALVEGSGINSTVRMTDVSKPTILKLIADLRKVCWEYQDKNLRNLSCTKIQADEIWNFCYAKEKNVPADKKGKFGYGNVWTWVALCADTKLVPCWYVGGRDAKSAHTFMNDLASRLSSRVQLTTDGHKAYLEAVEGAFGSEIDYAMLVKIYGNEPEPQEVRYSPAVCLAVQGTRIIGKPDPAYVSTSFVERQNLTMRMSMRRFTRLTNAHSKKIENLIRSIAIHYMHYNFVRINQTLRCTPAMAAGVTNKLWSIEDMVSLLV